METLKKIVKNQYFPAAAVLAAVVLFWIIAMFGGLSLLHNNQPPMATLTWMLFVYGAAVLTPLAGILAAMDLYRRWNLNRNAAPAYEEAAWPVEDETASTAVVEVQQEAVSTAGAAVEQEAVSTAVNSQPATNSQATTNPAMSQPLKKSAQAKQRKKAA
jgi:hypothetical protein